MKYFYSDKTILKLDGDGCIRTVNTLKFIELYTLKGGILQNVNFSNEFEQKSWYKSIFKKSFHNIVK